VRLDILPKSAIHIFVIVIECDGIESCVAAATVAASTSLAKAGIEMLGLVVSCAGVSLHHLPILVTPHDEQSGRDWRGCLVGSERGRGAIGIWNVAMCMYARIGRDDQCLADWSRASIQGIDGERQGFTC
jgi:ribonuclease PH